MFGTDLQLGVFWWLGFPLMWPPRLIWPSCVARHLMIRHPFYLVLFNIAKKNNLGNLIRTANAFGAKEILIVGKKRFHEFGSFGTSKASKKRHFYSLEEAVVFLREQNCTIYGVEILPQATAVDETVFDSPSAFMMGNEGDGLSETQIQACDRFVYIRQFGTGGSMNVNVAAGIVLHRFTTEMGYLENSRVSGQFNPSIKTINNQQ